MTIGQPDYLLQLNEASSSGSGFTNAGSQATSYTIGQGTETTHWVRHSGAGLYGAGSGYWESLTKSGANMPWWSCAATGPGTALETINCALGWRIASGVTAFDNGACRLVSPNGSLDGDARIWLDNLSGGVYDLNAQFVNTGSGVITMTKQTGLAVGTDYLLSCSFDPSTPSATAANFKLGSGSVITPATVNMTSFSLNNTWPYVGRRNDFSIYYGLQGNINLFVYQRGGTPWDSTDLAAINSAPATAFATWWVGGGSSSGLLLRRRR